MRDPDSKHWFRRYDWDAVAGIVAAAAAMILHLLHAVQPDIPLTITLVLVALIVLLQYPLWLGKGGWLQVWKVDQQLAAQREANQKLETRNAGLDAEVRDLKSGYEAIEERARYELGYIKPDEVFVQVPQKNP
mgnify:CR=1 FL=1